MECIAAHTPTAPVFEGDSSGPDLAEFAVLAEEKMRELVNQFGPEFLRQVGNQDGSKPTDKYLALHQGLFYLGRKGKLHMLKIAAPQEQYEAPTTSPGSSHHPG